MRAVIQRVAEAGVKVWGEQIAKIGRGLVVLVGIGKDDNDDDILWLANKIINLRIFEDEAGKFNYSILDIKGEILLVPQFTLYGDCRKGRRPSFDYAMPPDKAKEMFTRLFNYLQTQNLKVQKGIFGAKMDVELVNAGPVTIILDSKQK
ncbi:MAG TPA: D-tyrosyl-tRNA(Tyr) deacylase [Candidatus Omnitrophica bacterium]|nr:D-tyrosyl-tRNA(Tyr) deacylase [Candidatus Omnitrophota bacterium]